MQCRAPIVVVVAGRVCVKQERGKGEGGKCESDLACEGGAATNQPAVVPRREVRVVAVPCGEERRSVDVHSVALDNGGKR
jgi:hypothetical protein